MVSVLAVSVQQMRILAFDQATQTTGWSLWVDGELTDFGKFSYEVADIHKRIHRQVEQVKYLISEHEPDKVIIEDIQMQVNNVSTFQKLAWLQGAIIETLIQLNMPFELSRPSEWRAVCNFLKGQDKHRDNQKKLAQTWVREVFNQICTQDEADAICIGYAASYNADNELNWE